MPSSLLILSDLLQGCSNKSDIQYSHDITIFLQPCVDNLVTSLLYHGCNKLVSTVLYQARLKIPSSLLQVVNSLSQTLLQQTETSSAKTTC
jgi:hypothetical protein